MIKIGQNWQLLKLIKIGQDWSELAIAKISPNDQN